MLNLLKKKSKTIHILGAGVAGLAAAKEIKRKNRRCRVVVYEAKAHAGGRAFSYYNKTLDKEVDNATHVVLGCNKNVRSLMEVCEFEPRLRFWDGFNKQAYKEWWKCQDAILVSIVNTPAHEVAAKILRTVFWKLFPFTYDRRKIYYSHDNLSGNLIEPLEKYADEICCGCKLENFENQDGRITALNFAGGKRIPLGEDDVVISALDAAAYEQIFQGPHFEFEKIITLSFRTSQPLHLPGNARYLGVVNSLVQWVFVNYDVISVTISAANDLYINDEEIKKEVWAVLSEMRGLKPAFMPPCQLFHHERATLKQDAYNNSLRPASAKTDYKNLFVAGDWTMKNYPCCMESAVLSAYRAAKEALKLK